MRQTTIQAVRLMIIAAMAVAAAPAIAQGPDFDMGGVQVWNVDYGQTVSIGDYFGPNYKIDKIKPVDLFATRNCVVSGQLVVTNSNGPIRDLKVTTTELKQVGDNATGKIDTDRIAVRYADLASPQKCWAPTFRYDGLLPTPPEEVSVVDVRPQRGWEPQNAGPVAAITVWITVRVPQDAPAGDYEGTITVDGQNMAIQPVKVGLKLKVYDFVMPDPKDFQSRNLVWLNPDREALHYNVPVWSDKHFELMGKSLALASEIGPVQIFVNFVTNYPSQDNTETMVKWIKQADGSFKYDFSVFDRYMDLVAKNAGKPFPIRLNMWCPEGREEPKLPQVLMLDPKTGKTEPLSQPVPVGGGDSYKFWKPVWDEIKVRMDKRGWRDVTGPNWHQYCGGPTPPAVTMFKRMWPDGKWNDMDHGRRHGFAGVEKSDYTPVLVQSTVWNEGDMKNRGYRAGLKPDIALCGHHRGRNREWSPLWHIRVMVEEMLMRGNHGIDPIGMDMWPATFRGRIIGGSWSVAALGPGNATRAFLYPGPDGAVGTERFESLREGIQICEAMLFVQDALNSGKLEKSLAEKADKVLQERSDKILEGYPPSGKYKSHGMNDEVFTKTFVPEARARDEKLFAIATEVAAGLAKGPAPTTAPDAVATTGPDK